MYNTSYEEYMRTVLGYTPSTMQDVYTMNDYYPRQNNNNYDIQEMYPDIYKRIYPLVCNECSSNKMPITQENLEQMTDNIYNQIVIDLKIHTTADSRKDNTKNQKQEDRNDPRNRTLRDLIKILILNELLKGGGIFPGRPPFPRPRPPFPGPIRPREF